MISTVCCHRVFVGRPLSVETRVSAISRVEFFWHRHLVRRKLRV